MIPKQFRPAAGRAAKGAFLALAVMTAGATMAVAADGGGLTVSGAFMRTIIPARPAAGYFTLANGGDAERSLTGANSPACGSIMLHKSVTVNGVDKMIGVPSVTVPAHGSITFAPGGYHLMCMEPTAALKPSATVPVTLTFANGGSVTADFPVRGPGAN